MAYLALTLLFGRIASALPTAVSTISTATSPPAIASTSTAPLPRITAEHDLDKAGKAITVPALETVTYNTGDLIKVTEQRAWSLKSAVECRDLCWAAPKPATVDNSLPNCLGGSYNPRTELCQLAFNAQLVEGMERTKQCPLGWITYENIPVEKADERKGSKQKRNGDVNGKMVGEEDGYDVDGGIAAPCFDQVSVAM